jgi:hypothetical protein
MSHDFTGRKIKKKTPKGEVYQKYQSPAFQTKSATPASYRRGGDVEYASVDSDGINTAPVEKKTYTGTLIKGISTLHKSNAVPIISQEEAIDIANMRRN